MATNLFIIFPAPSHYYASFPFAKNIKEQNNEVVFTGSLNDEKRILNQGFIFLEIDYLTETVVKSFSTFFGLLLKSVLDRQELVVRYKQWRKELEVNLAQLESVKPTKVFIDEHLWYYLPVVYSFCKNVEMINTKLSTKKVKGFPPLCSAYIPRKNWLSIVICELIWAWHLVSLRLTELPKELALLNRTEDYFLRRFSKRIGLEFSTIFNRSHLKNTSPRVRLRFSKPNPESKRAFEGLRLTASSIFEMASSVKLSIK
jgi:hypothetical protein